MSFGVSLKRERELRGISLDEIAKATKISVRLLDAIEKDRFDVLPEGVFRKSFIKSYAKYIGIDEEQILHEYDLQVQPSSASQPAPEKQSLGSIGSPAGSKRVLVTIGILLLLAAAGCGLWFLIRASTNGSGEPTARQSAPEAQSPSQPPVETTSPSTALPIPPSTGAAGQEARPASDPPELRVLGELAKKPDAAASAGTEDSTPLELTMEASDPAWVSVTAGESVLFSGFINPPDSKKFSLEVPLKVVLGNAGGVRLEVNGQVFPTLGKTGERKSLEISAANYQQFLGAQTP